MAVIMVTRRRCHRGFGLLASAGVSAVALAACGGSGDGVEFELVAVDLRPGGTEVGFVWPGEEPAIGGPALRVVEGEQVTITLGTPPDGRNSHDLMIVEDRDGFWGDFEALWGAATDRVIAGQSDTITFVAGSPGTYGYVCTIPGHSDAGMKGDFIVASAS